MTEYSIRPQPSTNDELKALCETWNAGMASIFPNFIVKAIAQNIIGADCIIIHFANVRSVDEAPNRILENCTAHMRFMMNVNGPESYSVARIIAPRDKFIPKLRKINAKSAAEAMTKLAVYLSNNKDTILRA